MANLTITVDEKTLKRARIRALHLGTSVNAVLAEYLKAFAGGDEQQQRATSALFDLAAKNSAQGGSQRARTRGRRRWTRDELHER